MTLEGNSLTVKNCSKTFLGTKALENVSIEVRRGEVHALVGQNGSGKSTLFKILAGYHHPDPGAEIWVGNQRVEIPIDPGRARDLGLSFVHQDLGLVESMSVVENARMGSFQTGRLGRIRWRAERKRVREALKSFGMSIEPEAMVAQLSMAERAVVAVVRALESRSPDRDSLLLLDEPTSYLSTDQIRELFGAMEGVRSRGGAVVFTTHRLREVLEIADTVSVLRDGQIVGTYKTEAIGERDLVTALIGEELGDLYPDMSEQEGESIALKLSELTSHRLGSVSFAVHRGEVLGLTGLSGAGFEEVPYAVFGDAQGIGGSVEVDGQRHDVGSPQKMMKMGITFLPADRQRTSGLPSASVRENITMPVLGRYFQKGLLRRRVESRETLATMRKFTVRPASDPEAPLVRFSGGNQQKALLGKWLQMSDMRAFLLHEPTQGVDVSSRKIIFQILRDLAETGTAVVISSAEYEDLAHLCDRVLIFSEGAIVGSLRSPGMTEERILERCYLAESSLATQTTEGSPDRDLSGLKQEGNA